MGNANQKESLYDAINADDVGLVTQIIKVSIRFVPFELFIAIFSKSK